MKRLVIRCIFLLISSLANGQDAQFTQFYANPLYVNPAFAGSSYTSRLASIYRNQWNAFSGGFTTYSASFDHQFTKQRSGLGVMAMRDIQGSAGFQTTDLAVQYAYIVPISSKLAFRPGLQAGVGMRSIGNQGLFTSEAGQQFTNGAITGISENTAQTLFFPDFAVGGLWYTDALWLGLSAHHLSQPTYSFAGASVKEIVNIKLSAHAGYKIRLGEKPKFRSVYIPQREKSLIPAVNFRQQRTFSQLDVGMYAIFEPIMFGAWYRGIPIIDVGSSFNRDALALLVGINVNDISVGYSYDYTVSGLTNATGGSHEISIVYNWAWGKKARQLKLKSKMFPDMPIPCPNKKGNSYMLSPDDF